VNAQTFRRTQEMRGRDGIAKEIAAPLQLKLRLDFQEHLLNAYVVSFAGSKHEAMRAKTDSSLVMISRLVNDSQPAHCSLSVTHDAISTVTFIALSSWSSSRQDCALSR
jgi:hypothetical protein